MRRHLGDISVMQLCTERPLMVLVDKLCRFFGFYCCASCNASACTLCDTCLAGVRYLSPQLGTIDKFGHVSLFYYTKVVKKLFSVYKFEGSFQYQRVLERFIREYGNLDPFLLINTLQKKFRRILLLPVPMTRKKQEERGFSPAYEISIMLGRILHSSQVSVYVCPTLLLKVKETRAQSKKHRKERLLSIHNAFQVNVPAIEDVDRFAPDLIIVVDDVYTTGATITEIWDNIKKHSICEQLPKTTWISFSFARSLR